MAALFLLLLAVAGGVVVADLVLENTTAAQITLFHHTATGHSEGWLLAIAAGLGALVALLLVASVNATKARRVRRAQLRRLRRGLEHQVVAPEPDYARLLDEFFGPEEPPRHLTRPAGLAGPRDESRDGPAEAPQRPVTPQRIQHHPEPRYEQARRAAGLHNDWDLPLPASQGRRR
jgi:hypothetical protein